MTSGSIMSRVRMFFRAVLAGFCYSEGVLTTLAYQHHHDYRLIIFMAGSFLLGVSLTLAIFFGDTTAFVLLQCILCAFFFVSSVVLMIFLSTASPQNVSDVEQMYFPSQFAPTVLSLALASMVAVGISVALDIVFSRVLVKSPLKVPHDEESEAADWQSDLLNTDELSLNKSHRASAQPPIVRLGIDRLLFCEKTLHNRDSEGTLVVPVMSPRDDVSLNWLIQASMSAFPMYENNSENWMNSKPLRLGGNDQLDTHDQGALSSILNSATLPKECVARSNTTGLLFGVTKLSDSGYNITAIDLAASENLRSVSLTKNHFASQMTGSTAFTDAYKQSCQCPSESIKMKEDPDPSKTFFDEESRSNAFDQTNNKLIHIHQEYVRKSGQVYPCPHAGTQNFSSKAQLFINVDDIRRLTYSREPEDSLTKRNQQLLYPAFEPQTDCAKSQSSAWSLLEAEMFDGLESIPMAAPLRAQTECRQEGAKNISLHDWEMSKDQWFQLRNHNSPLFFSASLHRELMESISAMSAPSLHTYRKLSDHESKASDNTFSSLINIFYRCVTPPQQCIMKLSDQHAPNTSPIKKMIGRLKRKDSSVEIKTPVIAQEHKHSSSIATSMISVASGISSKSVSPRKSKKVLFSMTLFDHRPQRPVFPNVTTWNSRLEKANEPANSLRKSYSFLQTDRFWDMETGEFLDKSRVSSVASAIIGEYDREKWQNMHTLQKTTPKT